MNMQYTTRVMQSLTDTARRILPAALLMLAALISYMPAIRHGGFVWDDEDNVTDNALLRSPSGLRDIWTKFGPDEGGTWQYYPLTYTSFWLEYRSWGLSPTGYHLDNVLLHGLNAVLVWIILLRLRVPGAFLAAAVFAVHPTHAESVAWVTERKNVLSALFYFLSLLSFIGFFGLSRAQEKASSSRPAENRLHYYAGLAFFLCALASKTTAVTLPPALLLLLWWKNGHISRRELLLTAPLFLLAAGAGLVTVYIEKYPGGASGDEWTMTAVEHVLLAGRILWFYAGKFIWPDPLTFIYPRWEINQADWTQYLFPLGAIAAAAALLGLRKRIGRGPLAALLFYAVNLAPVLGFLDVYFMRFSYVADHFQYLAALGPAVLLSASAASVKRRALPAAAAAVLIPAMMLLTYRQSAIYESSDRVWLDTLSKNPYAWLAHNNHGVHLVGRSLVERAIPHYRMALRIKPDYPEGHNNLGSALASLGKRTEAMEQYREAIRLRPGYSEARYNYGVSLAAVGRPAEAAAQYREALRIDPDHLSARNNLGLALASLGRTREAIDQYRQAPFSPESRNNWGVALASQGRYEEAAAHYREAIRLNPGYSEAHNNLGLVLSALGKNAEAASEYMEALRIKPAYPEARNHLGVALSMLGRHQEAASQFREVLRSEPGHIEARNNLCLALLTLGRPAEAAAEYRELLRIKPDFPRIYYDLGPLISPQRIPGGEASGIQ